MSRPAATLALLTLAALTGCADPNAKLADTPAHRQFKELESIMVGNFDNEEQAASDSRFFHATLHIVPIWTDRSDGPWLYLEQAAVEKLDRPFRQRILHMRSHGKGQVESTIYAIRENTLHYAGAWKNSYPLSDLTPDQLRRREGCAVHLTRQSDGSWIGGTSGTGCTSDIRGATYATTEVAVFPDTIRSWDRGYDHDGRQVWGPTAGPYVFRKINPKEPPTAQPVPEKTSP